MEQNSWNLCRWTNILNKNGQRKRTKHIQRTNTWNVCDNETKDHAASSRNPLDSWHTPPKQQQQQWKFLTQTTVTISSKWTEKSILTTWYYETLTPIDTHKKQTHLNIRRQTDSNEWHILTITIPNLVSYLVNFLIDLSNKLNVDCLHRKFIFCMKKWRYASNNPTPTWRSQAKHACPKFLFYLLEHFKYHD